MKDYKAKAATLRDPERPSEAYRRHRERENALLEESGFEQKEGIELWVKGGVYFGREAALQYCHQSGGSG